MAGLPFGVALFKVGRLMSLVSGSVHCDDAQQTRLDQLMVHHKQFVGVADAVAERVAQGNLSVAITVREGDTSSLMAWLSQMQASLSQVVSGVRLNSESVATASAQMAQGNLDLSGHAEQQASVVQQIAATRRSPAQPSANAAKETKTLIGCSVNQVEQGTVLVDETGKTLDEIVRPSSGSATSWLKSRWPAPSRTTAFSRSGRPSPKWTKPPNKTPHWSKKAQPWQRI